MGGQCSVPHTAQALAKYLEPSALAGLWPPRAGAAGQGDAARAKPQLHREVGHAAAETSLLAQGLVCRAGGALSQRSLKLELLACLYHQGKNLDSEYEYTSNPPTVVGSGFSGDVVLCRRRERAAVTQNSETAVRCVKKFDLQRMSPDKLTKLQNEATIYLSLEHPAIARLFDVFEDRNEVSLVMQYCSGGTLRDALGSRGGFAEHAFKRHAVPMLSAVNYIHRAGIVHRDIKPRNWVYEADGLTVKLIDFGFSVKQFLGVESEDALQGCMGTLGYLAPEVVRAGLATSANYSARCDVWSLGVVFLELLTAEPAFHRDRGFCEGYTEEVVLREIQEVSIDAVERLLAHAAEKSRPFLRRLLTPDPDRRPSAEDVLSDQYLSEGVQQLLEPAKALPMSVVLERFVAHGSASKPSRAWLQALARSPTHLPWSEFCTLRDTFKMFDARGGFRGTVDLAAFCSTVLGAGSAATSPSCSAARFDEVEDQEHDEAYWDRYDPVKLEGGVLEWDPPLQDHNLATAEDVSDNLWPSAAEVGSIWRRVCGEQESLSYCEFLAVLLPPMEDVFEDATPHCAQASPSDGSCRPCPQVAWNSEEPVCSFLPLLQSVTGHCKVPVFAEGELVRDVVRAMSGDHQRWAVIRFRGGRHAFFDYMDVNRELLRLCASKQDGRRPSEVLAALSHKTAGEIANCSGFSSFAPCSASAPLRDVLQLMASGCGGATSASAVHPRARRAVQSIAVRRVPIVDQKGKVVHVFSCMDFLELAMRFPGPAQVLKRRDAGKFDRRDAILDVSVFHDDLFLDALRIMDQHSLPACSVTSRGLSGDMGGVVASNVVSVADLKWIISSGEFQLLDGSVDDFVAWRSGVVTQSLGEIIRQQRLSRFNVVSVQVCESLYHLAQRLLASKLQRVFLSSDDIARIVGIVGSRDILVEVIDELI